MKTGRKTKDWIKARERLVKEYAKCGIRKCEANLVGCWKTYTLNFAHRYKRSDPRCRHTFKQTILVCNSCHQKLDFGMDDNLLVEMFKKLRK